MTDILVYPNTCYLYIDLLLLSNLFLLISHLDEIFNRTPTAIRERRMAVPPKLINGRGKPVVGIRLHTTAIFTRADITIARVIPVASRVPYRSGADEAISIPLHNIYRNKTNITHVPMNPSSSPIIENIKSL